MILYLIISLQVSVESVLSVWSLLFAAPSVDSTYKTVLQLTLADGVWRGSDWSKDICDNA